MIDTIKNSNFGLANKGNRLTIVVLAIALTLFVAIATYLLTASKAASYLDNLTDIKAAIDRGDPEVLIANGIYSIPHGQGLVINTNGQKILGESDRGVKLIATGTRDQMGSKGVIEIKADNVEVGNLVLTQSVDQLTHRADNNTNKYMVAGIWSEGNSWYIHDLHIDKTSYGMQLWKGSSNSQTRRLERILVTNWGYYGTLFDHSGYGVYMQTPVDGDDVEIEIEDLVFQNGTDFGIHDYASFNMPGARRINGVAIVNTGSPTITGGSGGFFQSYLAKAADIEFSNLHAVQYRDQIPVGNAFGYSTSFNPERGVFNNIYALSDPGYGNPTTGNQPLKKQANYPVWQTNNVFSYDKVDQRSEFDGIKPLGDNWAILYGNGSIPSDWEVLPGSIEYPEKTSTNPSVPATTILRRSTGNPPPPPPPPPPEDTTAPNVSITSPGNNQQVSGTQTIELSASDNVGVTSVEFYVDGNLVHTKNSQPYTYNWDTSSVGDGTHQLRATAKDVVGNSGQSANVSVTVQNSNPDPDPDPGQNVSLSHFAYVPTGDFQTVKYTWSISGTYQPGNWIALFKVGADAGDYVVDSNYFISGSSGSRNQPIRVSETGSYEVRMYDDSNNLLATSGPLQLEFLGSEAVCEDPAANNYGSSLPCNYDPDPDPIQPGDTDGDTDVDIADLSKLLSDWDPQGNTPGSTADFNSDSKVDVVDLSVLLSNYGT